MTAAVRGYRAIFTMPDKMSQEKIDMLKAYGADVIVTAPICRMITPTATWKSPSGSRAKHRADSTPINTTIWTTPKRII
ncbi:MAG: hypothetical protein R3F53_12600 [Gammaproteobacteria bacterium]